MLGSLDTLGSDVSVPKFPKVFQLRRTAVGDAPVFDPASRPAGIPDEPGAAKRRSGETKNTLRSKAATDVDTKLRREE